jgi:hypothetical protein
VKKIIIGMVLASLVSFSAYAKGRTPTANSAVATSYATCAGGEGDVTISIDAKAELLIENSECSVRMALTKKTDKKWLVFKGIQADDSDTDLCGGSAVVTTNVLKGAQPITLKLQGGESAGTYSCTIK